MRTWTLITTGAALLLLAACSSSEKEKETEPVVPVQVAPATLGSIQRIVTADGELFPKTQSSITPKISAPVKQFLVNRGDHVREGQLVAVLENKDLAAAVADAKGAYEQAQAQFQNVSGATVPEEVTKAQQDVDSAREAADAARKVFESRQELLRQGAIARKLVDDANVAYVQARSQYEIAQEHLKSVQNVSRHQDIRSAQGQLASAKGKYEQAVAQLGYSDIHSPISGIIADRPLYPGEMASAGAPLLTVMDISTVIARANVPVGQAAYLKVGAPATITQTDANIQAAGKITVVSPAVDPATTTVQVWVEAPNPGERLRSGVTVKINAVAQTLNDVVIIPQAGLLPSAEGETVVMVVGPDMVAHERKIEVGVRQGEKVQILSGLKPGEQVITVGGVGLEDGAKVRIGAAKAGKDEGESKGKGGKDEDEK
jgi:multidrug efflux pump subunit AcrA (membrane-fusion protein)